MYDHITQLACRGCIPDHKYFIVQNWVVMNAHQRANCKAAYTLKGALVHQRRS
jgi:hypothetical protein